MKKSTYIISALVLAGLVAAGIFGYRMFNKPHRGIADEKPAFTLTVSELVDSFAKDAVGQHAKLNNQVVQFSGKVNKIKEEGGFFSLTFDNSGDYVISVTLDEKNEKRAEPESEISIKALYVGYLDGEPDFGIPGEIKLKNGFIQ